MRLDANKVSLKAIRNLFSGARAFELEVGGVRVTCGILPAAPVPWPASLIGVTPAEDGPDWPPGVIVDCTWSEGRCRLVVDLYHWANGKYLHDLCVRVRTDRGREVVFINVANGLEKIEDGSKAKLKARFFVTKRKSHLLPGVAEKLNFGMRDALKESKLPIISDSTAELCKVEVPSGALLPSPEAAFRRLIHLALLKLEFIDGRRARERGKPLIDLSRWLTASEQLASLAVDGDVAEDDAERDDESDADAEAVDRQYWAGGFGKLHRLEEFLAGDYWKIGWSRESEEPAAKRTWKHFARVRPGDYFAIKGLSGAHDLQVRYVGEVVSIDADDGRLSLRRLDIPLYKGKGPTKRHAGNWHDTLVPIERPDIISMIFGAGAGPKGNPKPDGPSPAPIGLPLNLILYGPPGTGKTYRITKELTPKFQRSPAAGTDFGSFLAISDELTWGQAVAVALHQLGGEADVDALVEHRLLKAKYAAKPMKVTLRRRIWSVLGYQTVDGSQTAGNRRRFGDKLFDKRPGKGSKWFLAAELPEELSEIVKRMKSPAPTTLLKDHAFVTFHQAYGYEDFIEGIRPVVDDAGDDEASALSYRLEDGVFMKAVLAALALAGYQGTLDQFCALPRQAREAQFANARPYALFIDEINRGNVARIFGELITLLEDDKRLGEENEIIVKLPYSKRDFGVPPNLHVIGTMNTADRSIEALDTALRRRFEFEELPPQPELLEFTIDGDIDPEQMLRTINRRLEKLYDRDHCIGHAYFTALADDPTLEGLKQVFRNKLIPLLQEYFFGDWGKIGLVLGKDFVRKRDMSGTPFADFDHEDREALENQPTWELADIATLSNVAFQRIYKHVADD